jgi:ATP-dependent DNA helicase PIF1
MAMGCHVCVKFVTKHDIWFYLFKYNFKLDKKVLASLYVQDPSDPNTWNVDEFNCNRELSFRGPYEAYDIITSERWAGCSHDPLLLSVHLPGEEPVFFMAGREEAAEHRVTNPAFRTKWTAYMALCREGEGARHYRFEEIERDYTFHLRDKRTGAYIWRFEPRMRSARGGMHIGMIYPPNPTNRKLFSTYLLALELRGIQSFEDLRTLNRPNDPDYDPSQPPVVCLTAIEACVHRGLSTDDTSWGRSMEAISCTQHSYRQFTRSFIIMLTFLQPSNPQALYDKYIDRMLSPPRPSRQNDLAHRTQELLHRMYRQLEEHGRRLTDFGLPEPDADYRTVDERVDDEIIPPVYDPQTGEPIEMTAEERVARADQLYQSCNADQRSFIDLVFQRLEELPTERTTRPNNVIVLKGEGGTGKTHAMNALIECSHARSIPIGVCASTGIAATHLLGGRTAHSLFGIPVDKSGTRSDTRFSRGFPSEPVPLPARRRPTS